MIRNLIVTVLLGVVLMSNPFSQESPPVTKTVLIPEGLDIINRLRDALESGTPGEKEAALEMIRALKPISLIPETIQAIEDPTIQLPIVKRAGCSLGIRLRQC
jgi:hypothetical protein